MILLWDKIVRRFLPLSAYEALVLPRSAYDKGGHEETTGLEAAITLHADAVLSRLDENQQVIARRIFIRLVHFGEGRPDTRRQQPQSALQANDDPALFKSTLAYLADNKSRLLALTGAEAETPKVDISHEALITAPSSIRAWIEEGRADELFRRDLKDDATKWQEAQGNTSFLYESTRLKQAETWAGRFHQEIDGKIQDFLKASDERDKRRRWQRRSFLVLLGLFALFGIGSAGYLIRQEMLKQAARGPMVSFTAGPALLGYGEKRTEVNVPAFRLDQFEVSNRQYELCVTADQCTPSNMPYDEGQEPPASDLPVTEVTAFQAATFCDWIGRRLPTAIEWERAVRGTNGRSWPWGEQSPIEPRPRVHILLSEAPETIGLEGPVAVDDPDFAGGVSLDGKVWNLLGNVREWTSSYASKATCPNPYREDCKIWDGRTVQVQALSIVGLGWADDLLSNEMERVSNFYYASPAIPDPETGFRCADSGP
jgi:formylglycine-generating enzyme required for sulfatase activity